MVQVSAKRRFLFLEFLSLFKFSDTCIFEFSLKDFSSLLTIRIGHGRVKNWLIFIFWGRPKRCQKVWIKKYIVGWSRTKNQFEKDPISCCDMWSEISKGFMRLFEAAILELPLTFYVHKDWIYLCKKSKKKRHFNFFGIFAALYLVSNKAKRKLLGSMVITTRISPKVQKHIEQLTSPLDPRPERGHREGNYGNWRDYNL